MKFKPPCAVVLRENLDRLMAAARPRLTQAAVARLSGIPQRTVGRIKNGEQTPTLTMLDGLAKAFRVEPWQLLVPSLRPGRPPQLVGDEKRMAAIERVAEAAKDLVSLEKS